MIIKALVSVAVIAAIVWWIVGAFLVTDNELNACAVILARADYLAQGENQEDADQALIVDTSERPDILSIARNYDRRPLGAETVYQDWVKRGRRLCIKKHLTGERITAPVLKIRTGYHVTRANGGAALVKDGDPEPIFEPMR
jgi:hypothetical protein